MTADDGELSILREVVQQLDELPEDLVISVPDDRRPVDALTPVLLLDEEDEQPRGWRSLLDLLTARDVLEDWSARREGRTPALDEACAAIVRFAEEGGTTRDNPMAGHGG
ncbi:hypothetical protein [Actinoplanes sp. NPDC049265]|uniref:hypothetical protein n=1 Tax=Actinoplanes sp. NPDC049265 TaxID=3363902 RepID=UPI003712A9ED